jgi:hypothetical protein
MNAITILTGHTNQETAYVVTDYPYGFRLRCEMRYWLDCHPTRGARLMQQSSNPKRPGTWNKPKTSTYARFAGAMFLNDEGHVKWSGLTEYTNGAEAKAWADTYGAGVPDMLRRNMEMWVTSKLAFDARREAGGTITASVIAAQSAAVSVIKQATT